MEFVNRVKVIGGAVLAAALAAAVFAVGPNDTEAAVMIERIGGRWEGRYRFGWPVIEEVYLPGCSPTPAELATIGKLRSVRIIDLSGAHIGDRGAAALVGTKARMVVLPAGCVSEAVKERFRRLQLSEGNGPYLKRAKRW